MVLIDHVCELPDQFFSFCIVQFIDDFREAAKCEYALPSSHRVGADDWMNSAQMITNIFW